MMKVLVTVLLVSFSTTVLTDPTTTSSGVDSNMVLGQLETALSNYGAGVSTFKDTLQRFITGFKTLATDYMAQFTSLTEQANVAEAAKNEISEAQLETQADAFEDLSGEYTDVADMLEEVLTTINDQQQKLGEVFDKVRSGLKSSANIEAQLQPSIAAPEPPVVEPEVPIVVQPVPEPTRPTSPTRNRDLQALLERLLAAMTRA